jgi:transposase
MFAAFVVKICRKYYKKNLTPNILSAARTFYFNDLVFHVFVLVNGTRKQIFRHRRLLKKVLPEAIKLLKKRFPDKDIKLWFQDEARIGQQGTICRIWADTGSCPRAIRQTNYQWTYLFGSVCPATGQCHGWRMPYANTWIMNLYLKDFAKQLPKDVHALLVMDKAGWHSSKGLEIPANVSILLLPAYSPELNPAELIWRQLRQRKLSNRLYTTIDDLEAAVDEACLWISNRQDELSNLCLFPWIESALINWH